jgi:hypothetical protein
MSHSYRRSTDPKWGIALFSSRPIGGRTGMPISWLKMRALAGPSAQLLRHLDFLINRPERSVLICGGGVPVTIPRAERFVVHKFIVAVERQDQVKSRKRLQQAETLSEVLLQDADRTGKPPGIPGCDGAQNWRQPENAYQNRRRRISTLCLHAQR